MILMKKEFIKFLLNILFMIYMVVLIYFLFFSEEYGRGHKYEEFQYNLTLFKEIRRYIHHYDVVGIEAFFVNIIGNVIVFMPFGFFVPGLIGEHKQPIYQVICVTVLGLVFSLTVEIGQLITKVGCFDVDDLFLNTVGAFVGVVIYHILYAIYSAVFKKKRRKRKR